MAPSAAKARERGFVKFIPAKEKTRFAKEWRKVMAKDHVIRIDSHEVFNTAQLSKLLGITFYVFCSKHLKFKLLLCGPLAEVTR